MKHQQNSHRATAISVWGTSSHVGKSLFCAGLGRVLSNRGYSVAPFKAQNMSNNSAVTEEGGEIGRAQACQAEACRVAVTNDLNPLLLKPTGEKQSQVVLQGKVKGSIGSDFGITRLDEFKRLIADSYDRLASRHDVVLIEGAGGCAELNLRHRDLANEWITDYANAKVILIGDIERGGVFASLLGSLDLLSHEARSRIIGLVVNKFRGTPELFEDGVRILEERSGIPVLGVLPYIENHHLPDEDGASFQARRIQAGQKRERNVIRVGVIMTPHISNSTDVEALIADPRFDVDLLYEPSDEEKAFYILPGSKNVIEDLVQLKNKGMDSYLIHQNTKGKLILGICGGYQMLGTVVQDPYGVESNIGSCEGMGLLNAETTLLPKKITQNIIGTFIPNGKEIRGYEIHCGRTVSSVAQPLIEIQQEQSVSCFRKEGMISEDGLVWGTYVHGIFDSIHFRNHIAQHFGMTETVSTPEKDVYELLATTIQMHINMNTILAEINDEQETHIANP